MGKSDIFSYDMNNGMTYIFTREHINITDGVNNQRVLEDAVMSSTKDLISGDQDPLGDYETRIRKQHKDLAKERLMVCDDNISAVHYFVPEKNNPTKHLNTLSFSPYHN